MACDNLNKIFLCFLSLLEDQRDTSHIRWLPQINCPGMHDMWSYLSPTVIVKNNFYMLFFHITTPILLLSEISPFGLT